MKCEPHSVRHKLWDYGILSVHVKKMTLFYVNVMFTNLKCKEMNRWNILYTHDIAVPKWPGYGMLVIGLIS